VPVHPQHKPQHRTVSASTQHLTPTFNTHPDIVVAETSPSDNAYMGRQTEKA